jgi:phosphatidylglycerol lysyltransferase
VALCAGDPAGKHSDFAGLLNEFAEFCKVNDWLAAFIHTEEKFTGIYAKKGYSVQKIGEEAILHLSSYQEQVRGNKYFRQIRNKFEKKGYSTELLQPPHNDALLQRLNDVSQDWLTLPGRAERGFMMGYFNAEYLQQCPIMVLRDAAGTIQAFINQIPSYDTKEANYDLLRHTKQSMTNSNDYLLTQFIDHVTEAGFERLNLGLCPLSGLDNNDQENTTIDNLLKFVYANGDRFYSFSGLRRFKGKYEPEWTSRYIAYRGGIRGFTRTVNALNKALNRSAKHHK